MTLRNDGILAVAILCSAVLASCAECRKPTDCPNGQTCVQGDCIPISTPDTWTDADAEDTPPDTVEDDAGEDGDAGDQPDTVPDPVDADALEDPDLPEWQPCTTDAECDDENPCTTDTCFMEALVCVHVDADGTFCDDGLYCNGLSRCQGGECVDGAPPECVDADPCIEGACDEGIDDCGWWTLDDHAFCDNGFFCDGTDECIEGWCQPLYDVACNDGSPCTEDTCSSSTDACAYEVVTMEPDLIGCGDTSLAYVSGANNLVNSYLCGGTSYAAHTAESLFRIDLASATTLQIDMETAPEDTTEFEIFILTDVCDPGSCVAHGGRSLSVPGVSGTVYFTIERNTFGGAWVNVTCS